MELREYLLNHFEAEYVDAVLIAKRYTRLFGSSVKTVYSHKNTINIEICTELYITYKLPFYKIAMLYGVSDVTIRTYLLKSGIKSKGHKMGVNSFNEYFKKIDSPDKAYFLGLLIADGNLSSGCNRNKKVIQISLTEGDNYILKRFSKYADTKSKFYVSHKENSRPGTLMQIHSVNMYYDLIRLGLQERKSTKEYIPFDLVPKKLHVHLIRGYFDGDGIANRHGYIGFCGGEYAMHQIKDYLIKKLHVNNVSVTYNKSNHIYYVQWSAKENCKTIFKYFYKDKNDLYLTRKYDKLKLALF